MKTILCTLYNTLYLDKGLVLYDSLRECAKDFKLYVLCMDDKCYEVLAGLNQEYHIPVRLSDPFPGCYVLYHGSDRGDQREERAAGLYALCLAGLWRILCPDVQAELRISGDPVYG